MQFMRKVWHHAIAHGHDIVLAFVVEGSKGNVIMILLMIAALFIALAAQTYFVVEE